MLEFPCPSCGRRFLGEDSLAGQNVCCPGCNAALTMPGAPVNTAITDSDVPHSSRPRYGDDAMSAPSVIKKTGFAWSNVATIVLIVAVLLTLLALMVPSVERVREAAGRTQSVNNLKQIGIGAQAFHDGNQRLPFNGTVDAKANDPASGSWLFQILPYIDQQVLFANPNPKFAVGVQSLMCPGRGRPSFCATGPWSDYAINPWVNDDQNGIPNAADSKRQLKDITDGSSNTIFAGHGMIDTGLYASNQVHAQSCDIYKGGEPATARRSTSLQRDQNNGLELHWGGPFPQGMLSVWCDATVRMVPYSQPAGGDIQGGTARSHFGAFLTPRGGEAVVLPD